jgi:biopolymer transport protein TolR
MQSSVQGTPNVTPMVDVMLVLLIIFMVVAPTLLDGFVAEPPNAANVRDHPIDSADVTLGIDAGGRYYLNKTPVDAATLGVRLEGIFERAGSDRVLYLKADQELEYAKILAAVDTARNHGVIVVGMITRQPTGARR